MKLLVEEESLNNIGLRSIVVLYHIGVLKIIVLKSLGGPTKGLRKEHSLIKGCFKDVKWALDLGFQVDQQLNGAA